MSGKQKTLSSNSLQSSESLLNPPVHNDEDNNVAVDAEDDDVAVDAEDNDHQNMPSVENVFLPRMSSSYNNGVYQPQIISLNNFSPMHMSAPVHLNRRMIEEMADAAATLVDCVPNPMLPMMNGMMSGINFSGFATQNNTFGLPHIDNTMMDVSYYTNIERGNGLALTEDLANMAHFSNLGTHIPLCQMMLTQLEEYANMAQKNDNLLHGTSLSHLN